MNTNPCPSYSTCDSAYCPASKEGIHVAGDEICFRIGSLAIQRFNRSATDAEPGEIQGLIQLAYDNRVAAKQA